nr:pentapeptide repeat-containing protein [Streptomyces sp. SID8356]
MGNTGSGNTGSGNIGSGSTGPGNTVPGSTGPGDIGSGSTGPGNIGGGPRRGERGRWSGRRLKGAALLLAGALLCAVGGFIVVTGTGLSKLFGMRVETFGRIACHDTRAEKGQTVWHCFGETEAQQRANDAERERVARESLRVHVDGMPASAQIERTRITFADHDGRDDPETITATQAFEGGRWYAHSGQLVVYGMIPLLAGAGTAAWGVYRVREAAGARGR